MTTMAIFKKKEVKEGDEIIHYVSARTARILEKYNIITVEQLLNEALVYWMRIEELSKEHIDEIMRNIVYPYLRK